MDGMVLQDGAKSVSVLPDGYLMYNNGHGSNWPRLVRTDFEGNVIWGKSYSPVPSFGIPISKTNLIVLGDTAYMTYSHPDLNTGEWLTTLIAVSIENEGSVLWTKFLDYDNAFIPIAAIFILQPWVIIWYIAQSGKSINWTEMEIFLKRNYSINCLNGSAPNFLPRPRKEAS